MEDWQKRVVEERKELDGKMVKLADYIKKSPVFEKLSPDDKSLMRVQYTCMLSYRDVLDKRIARF